MRLWPTTPILVRETTKAVEIGGERIPKGTQVVISNLLGHRNPDRLDQADRFAPETWVHGDAASEPSFNHFSRGPQACPGATLAIGVGEETLGSLIDRFTPRTLSGFVDPAKPMPRMLDFFSIRIRLDPVWAR